MFQTKVSEGKGRVGLASKEFVFEIVVYFNVVKTDLRIAGT
jgi:hypothetical protein